MVEYRFEKTIAVVGLVNFIIFSVKQNVTLIIPKIERHVFMP